jgi:hypothetical protein
VDYLLSAGQLGGSQRDRIFARLAESLHAQERRPADRARVVIRRLGVVGLAACVAVLALMIGPRGAPERDQFRSKGGAAMAIPSSIAIDVACLHGTLSACSRGSLLAFSVDGGGFVTAYLDSAGPSRRVWLLRNEPTAAQAPGATGLLARGARLPEDQLPGRYGLAVLITRRPLSLAGPGPQSTPTPVPAELDLASGGLVGRARFDLTVTR